MGVARLRDFVTQLHSVLHRAIESASVADVSTIILFLSFMTVESLVVEVVCRCDGVLVTVLKKRKRRL